MVFQNHSNSIWNSNLFSDWCVDKVYDYARPENQSLVKARMMAAAMPVFLALQLSFELVLSIPRTIVVIAVSAHFIVRLAKGQERSQEKQELLNIATQVGDVVVKTVKIAFLLLFGALGLIVAGLILPSATMRQLAIWNIVSSRMQFLMLNNQDAEPPLRRIPSAEEFYVVGEAPRVYHATNPAAHPSVQNLTPRLEAANNHLIEERVQIIPARPIARIIPNRPARPVRRAAQKIPVYRSPRSPLSWDTIRGMMMNDEESARQEMKKLINYDIRLFYQKISEHNPNLNKSHWNLFISNPYYLAFVEVLVEASPREFLDRLLKKNAYAELPSDEQGIISLNCRSHLRSHEYAVIELYESDSMLELVLNKYPLHDQSERLLKLFSDAMPELWLKQALVEGALPLLYRFNHSKLHHLFRSYPYLHQQYTNWHDGFDISFEAFLAENLENLIESDEAIEVALLIKSKPLLYQIAKCLGEEGFKADILRLSQKYPRLKEELLEIGVKVFQEEYAFTILDFRVGHLLGQNVSGLIGSYMGMLAALFSRDTHLIKQVAQQLGEEGFSEIVDDFCYRYPSLKPDIVEMLVKLSQEGYSHLTVPDHALLLTAAVKALTSTSERIRYNLNKYPLMMRVLVEELLQRCPSALYDYLLTPQNNQCEWVDMLWKSEEGSFLRALLQRTPSLFAQVMLAPDAMKRLAGLRSLGQNAYRIGSIQEPFCETDSLLDLVVRQFHSSERCAFLFDLFEEYLPDLWMRQALLQSVSILNKVHEHELLYPILKAYPYTQEKHLEWQNEEKTLSFVEFFHLHLTDWVASGEAFEMALLLKSDEALKRINQQEGEESFRLAMAGLCSKYPALADELREKEQTAFL